jgi:hypothetical protein
METELSDPSDEKPVLVIGAAGLDMVGRLKAHPQEEAFKGGRSNEAEIQTFFRWGCAQCGREPGSPRATG